MTIETPDLQFLHQAVFRALQAALCLSDAQAARALIRAYVPAPPQDPGPDENVCFYHLQPDAQSPQTHESAISQGVPEAFTFAPFSLFLTFYGPACVPWAHRAQSFLFLDGPEAPLSILRSAGLYLVPPSHPPVLLYEDLAKTHRPRADVTLQARLALNTPYASAATEAPASVPTLNAPPAVSVHLSRSS